MLEKIASKFQTVVLVVLVTMLSLVFILEFGGPQSEGCTSGGASYAIKVHGKTISEGDFAAAFTLVNGNRLPPEMAKEMRGHVLDGLVESGLLAHEAEAMGLNVEEEEVWKRLRDEQTLLITLGEGAPFPGGPVPVPVLNEEGKFDPEQTKRLIQNYLRRSVAEFAEWQMDEILADRMRALIVAGAQVSPTEVWDAFVRDREKARIRYIRFAASHYREELNLDEAILRQWMAENASTVDSEYQASRHRYTGLEAQVRARHILVKVDANAPEETRALARGRIEALLARARSGEEFAALAKANSEDPGSARKGGDLGYNPRGRMVPPFDEAQFSLEVGQISDVVESSFGFHIIKVEGKREGDVPEEEAKLEISERLYRDQRAMDAAREAAERALGKLREGVSLDELDAELARAAVGPMPSPEEQGTAASLPARDPSAPKVEESRDFGRSEAPISGPFDSTTLARKVFEMGQGDLVEEPFALGQELVIFRVESLVQARREDFTDEERSRVEQSLLAAKRDELLRIHVATLREQAEKEGALKINEAIVRGDDDATQGASETETSSS